MRFVFLHAWLISFTEFIFSIRLCLFIQWFLGNATGQSACPGRDGKNRAVYIQSYSTCQKVTWTQLLFLMVIYRFVYGGAISWLHKTNNRTRMSSFYDYKYSKFKLFLCRKLHSLKYQEIFSLQIFLYSRNLSSLLGIIFIRAQ